MKLWLSLLLLSASLWGTSFDLPKKIKQLRLNPKGVSVYVKQIGAPKAFLLHNIQASLIPASVIKLYTTYTALLQFGFEHRWETKLFYDGDVYIQGTGDPSLKSSHIKGFVNALKEHHIKEVYGDIVIDRTLFSVPKANSAKFDENPLSAYNALPDAMMYNKRLSLLCVHTKKGKIVVDKGNDNTHYSIKNDIKAVNGSCRGRRSWFAAKVKDDTSTPVVCLSGVYSKRCKKRVIPHVLSAPYYEFYADFVEALKKENIGFNGKLVFKEVNKEATLLYTHYSKPLETIIAHTNKKSDNLYARQILLSLGASIYGKGVDVKKGQGALVSVLSQHKIPTKGTVIDNGSGLSKHARVNALSMARLLQHGFKHYKKRWMNMLSIAGVDGTIKRRFAGSVVQHKAWMKTGTIKHVKNIAGYVQGKSGKYYVVVILVNDKNSRISGAVLENDLIKWLAKEG